MGRRAGRRPGTRRGGGRVLFLTQVLPYPLDAGPKVRAYHVLRWLAERAPVHLVSFVRPEDPPEAIAHLRSLCDRVDTVPMHRSRMRDARALAGALSRGTSLVIDRDRVPGMERLVADVVERGFDAVHADQLWMARYARGLDAGLRVLDDHNAVYRIFERLARHEARPWRRMVLRREARLLAAYEAAQVRAFDRLVLVSEADRRAIAAVCDEETRHLLAARSSVLPICIDTARQRPVDVRADARQVTVLGTMYWPPNVEGVTWMARRVWPLVRSAVPGARLAVIGRRPPESLRRALDAAGGAEAVGYVSDLGDHLCGTAVFAVPLLSGGGMRVKILDAWAWGLPVVSTTVGAEGISVRPGHDIELADDPEGFAAAIVALLGDAGRRWRLGAAGRVSVEQRYDARVAYGALAQVYQTVVGS